MPFLELLQSRHVSDRAVHRPLERPSLGDRSRRQRALALCLAGTTLLSACSLFDNDDDRPAPVATGAGAAPHLRAGHAATVHAGGLTLSADASTLVADADLHVTDAEGADVRRALPAAMQPLLADGGTAWNIDLGGQQPMTPLHVSAPLPAGIAADQAVVITVHDGIARVLEATVTASPAGAGTSAAKGVATDAARGTSAAATGSTVSFEASQLSSFWVTAFNPQALATAWVDSVGTVLSGLDSAAQASTAKVIPQCAGKTLKTSDGRTIDIASAAKNAPGNPLSLCLAQGQDDTVIATVNSHDLMPWRVTTQMGKVSDSHMSSPDDALAQRVYDNILPQHGAREGLLTTGGQLSFSVPLPAGRQNIISAHASQGLYLADMATFTIAYLFQVATAGEGANALALPETIEKIGHLQEVADCVSQAAAIADPDKAVSADQARKIITAAASCSALIIKAVDAHVSNLVGVFTSALTTGLGLVVGGFLGALRLSAQATNVTWNIGQEFTIQGEWLHHGTTLQLGKTTAQITSNVGPCPNDGEDANAPLCNAVEDYSVQQDSPRQVTLTMTGHHLEPGDPDYTISDTPHFPGDPVGSRFRLTLNADRTLTMTVLTPPTEYTLPLTLCTDGVSVPACGL